MANKKMNNEIFMSNFRRAIALLFFSASLLSAIPANAETYRNNDVEMKPVKIDINQYVGKYYEIARYPFRWEKDCTAVTATYKLLNKDTISILNTCNKNTPTGKFISYEGEGKIVGDGKLKVSFVPIPLLKRIASGDYWVLYTSKDYTVSVVGSPNGKTGWILSKEVNIPKKELDKSLEVLKSNGYDLSRLIYTKH